MRSVLLVVLANSAVWGYFGVKLGGKLDLKEFEMNSKPGSDAGWIRSGVWDAVKDISASKEVTIPYCKPNDEGNMPTFWRGFWPYAGSGEKENPYSRCLDWDKQPFCSIEQIAEKIKMHKTNVHDVKRPSFLKKSYVNPLITQCADDKMPIKAFKTATAWSRMTWMQRHVLRVWERTNYCSQVWDFDGDAAKFDDGNWCFIVPDTNNPYGEYDVNGVARKYCKCPPGSDDPANYPDLFVIDSTCTGPTDTCILSPSGVYYTTKDGLDNPNLDSKVKNQYGKPSTCDFLLPGFLPNDTFLITCDASLDWSNTEKDRDLTEFPILKWIHGIPESWYWGRFVDPDIWEETRKTAPNTKVQIHDWYYDDGRIDGMYAANNHYPGFPAKKARHDFKKLKIRTRTHPRKIRLTTNPDTAKEAKHPWTQTQRNYFSFKDFNVRNPAT